MKSATSKSVLRTWVRLGAIVLCLSTVVAAPLSFAAGKAASKKKPPPGPKNAALSNALKDKGPQVQKCAVDQALEKGAKKVDINVRVTIKQTGEVVDSQVTVNVVGADGAKVKACVEEVLKTAKFPKVNTPLATDERSWSMAEQ